MNTLCRIRDIYRSIITYEVDFQRQFGISLNEGMLLCTLKESGQLSSGEIADLLGLTNSNASKVLRLAEDKLLIHRILGENDRRQMYFEITKKGRQLISEIKKNEDTMQRLLDEVVGKKAE